MRFTPNFLDELRARLPVSVVVGRKVRLKKQGREWRGLSPFTQEKTPSFYVNDQKGRWFDFSAGKNGNVFDFLMETEGLSFPEAVEKLAGEAGLQLPTMSPEDNFREERRSGAIEAMEAATLFFEAQLRSAGGGKARTYLDERGVPDALRAQFRLGFAPRERFALRDHLAGKGFSRDTMIAGGLLIHGDDIEVPFDRFRDRVMFPIGDRAGRVIAFGGRALDPDAPAKYLNSPQTDLFNKGGGLYNLHQARRAAGDRARVVVVEGYMDVIAMTGAGVPEAVAPLGTALTPEQCALLWTMAPEPTLCFDGDRAGRKAAARAIDTALPLIATGRTLRFALLPDGLDPDDLARSGGADAVEAVLAGALPLVDMLWTRERDETALETPEQRTALLERLSRAAEAIADRDLRRSYQSDLRGRAFEHFRSLRPPAQPPRRPGSGPRPGEHVGPDTPMRISGALARSAIFGSTNIGLSVREATILTALIDFPALIAPHVEEIAALSLPTADADRLRHLLLHVAEEEEPDHEQIADAIGAAGLRETVDRIVDRAGTQRIRAAAPHAFPLDAAASLRQALALQLHGPALNTSLQAALAAYSAEPNEKNWQILRDVRAQAWSRDGLEATAEAAEDRPINLTGR